MPDVTTIDFVSSGNGRDYRLAVWTPPVPAPAAGFPVLWLLDGGGYHGLAIDMVRNRGVLAAEIEPAVVVAVSYPVDAIAEWMTRRWLDFTLNPPSGHSPAGAGAAYGGLDGFIEMLAAEALPRVVARAPVDCRRMALFGHSMGGVAVLHALFTRPGLFASWLAISPSIWWNDHEILAAEAAFAARVRAGEVAPRVFIAVGALEEEPLAALPAGAVGADLAAINRQIATVRMVGNASELAQRLQALPGRTGYAVRYACHDGETHMSVPFAAMRAALDLALPPPLR